MMSNIRENVLSFQCSFGEKSHASQINGMMWSYSRVLETYVVYMPSRNGGIPDLIVGSKRVYIPCIKPQIVWLQFQTKSF